MEDICGEVGREYLINRAWRLGVAADQQIGEKFKFFYLQGPNYLTAVPLPPIFVKMIVSLGERHFINRKEEENESTGAKSIR